MWKIASSLFLGLTLLGPVANAQFNRQEVVAFESAMMSPKEFLAGEKGTTVTLAGYLRLPDATKKNPVVILFHGVEGLGGAGGQVQEWSRVLNEAGIGTLTVDSFSGRGVATMADAAKVKSHKQSRGRVPRPGIAREASAGRRQQDRSDGILAWRPGGTLFEHGALPENAWKTRPAVCGAYPGLRSLHSDIPGG